ncbi:MAG: ornithine cyclodeaminase [Clostridia bacterium]|nr:ornithine cyclodeaminase [Clostridia bacterium]
MKIISFDDMLKLNIPAVRYYQWVEDMIRHKDQTILPPKISIKPYEGVFCNVMPSFVHTANADYEGVKLVTRYPSRAPSLDSNILLLNAQNGEYLALMNADRITALRTGAVAAHSIMLFAKKGYRTIGMMGLGNVARATLYMLLEMNPDKTFEVKLLRYKNTEALFAERFQAYPNVTFTYADDCASLVKGADVVVSGVTYAPTNFCPDDAFDEGVLVVPIHTLGFTNCDLFFDKVFADDTAHVCHFKNFDRFKYFSEVTEVVNGLKPGRENPRERILAYNIGISIHDIYFAAHLYEMLKDDPNLPDIDVTGPKEKYWF